MFVPFVEGSFLSSVFFFPTQVDCTKETPLCAKQNIRAYPTWVCISRVLWFSPVLKNQPTIWYRTPVANSWLSLVSREWAMAGKSSNPGQNCRDNSCFSPSPYYNVDFSRSPKSGSVHRSLACFNILWGEGGRKKSSERRTNVAHITMEACTVNSLLFAQNLKSVPKCFDPDCLKLSFIE